MGMLAGLSDTPLVKGAGKTGGSSNRSPQRKQDWPAHGSEQASSKASSRAPWEFRLAQSACHGGFSRSDFSPVFRAWHSKRLQLLTHPNMLILNINSTSFFSASELFIMLKKGGEKPNCVACKLHESRKRNCIFIGVQ